MLKQVVEEEQNVADVRNQHADFSKKAAKLSSKVKFSQVKNLMQNFSVRTWY